MQNYWFYIESYVYISVKKRNSVLFNTLNKKTFTFNNKKIIEILTKIKRRENHQVILLSERNIEEWNLMHLIKYIRENYLGDIIDVNYSTKKPIQFIPYLKIHKDIKFYLKKENNIFEGQLKNYLHELTIFLDNECKLNCDVCKYGYKQFTCCTKEIPHKTIDKNLILNFLLELRHQPLSINLLGSMATSLNFIKELQNNLDINLLKIKYYNHILNIEGQLEELSTFLNLKLCLIITFPKNLNHKEIINKLKNTTIDVRYYFLVKEYSEFQEAERLIEDNNINDYHIQPFYINSNIEFFKENVFIDKSDLQYCQTSFKEIFTNETINRNYFGKLTILNDGNVYSSLYNGKLGSISDSVKSLILKEFKENFSWRKLRKFCYPCRECAFNSLCPPLSNIENAIGQNNLCNIL